MYTCSRSGHALGLSEGLVSMPAVWAWVCLPQSGDGLDTQLPSQQALGSVGNKKAMRLVGRRLLRKEQSVKGVGGPQTVACLPPQDHASSCSWL